MPGPESRFSAISMYIECCQQLEILPASYVVRNINAERMRLAHHGLRTLGAKALCVPLVTNSTVIELDLEDNWLMAKGGVYVSEMLRENCYITKCNLANNLLNDAGIISVASMLAVRQPIPYLHSSLLLPPSSAV